MMEPIHPIIDGIAIKPNAQTKDVWVSTAVTCTIYLSILYFLVYLALQLSRYYHMLLGEDKDTETPRGYMDVWKLAALRVNFSPMVDILFLSARFRSMQLSPLSDAQVWAELCFGICTFCFI